MSSSHGQPRTPFINNVQCKSIPTEVKMIEERLSQEYDTANETYLEKRRRARKLAFVALKSPSQKAEYSIPQFLQKYFLGPDGELQKWKTPHPLALHNLSNRFNMHQVAERVPGLYTASGGAGLSRVLFIGWNRTEVNRKARTLPALRAPDLDRRIENLDQRRQRILEKRSLAEN